MRIKPDGSLDLDWRERRCFQSARQVERGDRRQDHLRTSCGPTRRLHANSAEEHFKGVL